MEEAEDQSPLNGLEERLHSHAHAFESLLALTPARDYYGSSIVDGQDPSEQWSRKKQTKEQKRAAKKAKLDPANQKSALDVLKEREAVALKQGKRKRDDNEIEDGGGDGNGSECGVKRQKGEDDGDAAGTRRRERAERRKEKRMRKKEKKEQKTAKAEAKKARSTEQERGDEDEQDPEAVEQPVDLGQLDVSGLVDPGPDDEDNVNAVEEGASPSSVPPTPLFDIATNHSAASSSSSIIPPSLADQPHLPPQERQPPNAEHTETSTSAPLESPRKLPSGTSSPKINFPNLNEPDLHARVRARIEAMRAARKADGPDGKPVKSRQELLEQRRKKQEQKKAAMKAQRQKEKEDEQKKREERLRGDGSPLSSDIFSLRSPQPQSKDRENSYSFSRLAFSDGTAADPSLSSLQDQKKKKGPQDARTALQVAQNKASRISGYDSAKQNDIRDKEMWLNAKRRAHGEHHHARDNVSLLKNTLKRQEKQKAKSEKEWKEREQAVVKGREMKQSKREANLQKRKEERGGKKVAGKAKGHGGQKKRRPGFEGRFKV